MTWHASVRLDSRKAEGAPLRDRIRSRPRRTADDCNRDALIAPIASVGRPQRHEGIRPASHGGAIAIAQKQAPAAVGGGADASPGIASA